MESLSQRMHSELFTLQSSWFQSAKIEQKIKMWWQVLTKNIIQEGSFAGVKILYPDPIPVHICLVRCWLSSLSSFQSCQDNAKLGTATVVGGIFYFSLSWSFVSLYSSSWRIHPTWYPFLHASCFFPGLPQSSSVGSKPPFRHTHCTSTVFLSFSDTICQLLINK